MPGCQAALALLPFLKCAVSVRGKEPPKTFPTFTALVQMV